MDATTIRFDDVVIDLDAREVTRAGAVRHLEPQAFDVMVLLIRNRHRVVPKTELLDEVWGHHFVSESALTTRIKEVRHALGDDGRKQAVVKNIRGLGYRFVAEVRAEAGQTGHRLQAPGREVVQLVGRDRELAAARALVESSPVVTLVGPGGVGKTALAIAVASLARPEPADGSIVVRLDAVNDPDSVVAAVGHAAGLAGPSRRDTVAAQLAELDALLVLDNCEHVVDAVAGLVDELTRKDGPLRVLATSRERLGVNGEQVLPLDVLEMVDARELFVARAATVVPDFDLEDRQREDLDRLLRALDHLPLAIEMAAARVGAISVPDLAGLITERLDVLESPHRSSSQRHRNLDALVAWSEELLDDRSRSVLADFSVFAGAVRADDIAGVLGDDGTTSTLATVAGLVDRSLIVADTTFERTTYRMLSTIRSRMSVSREADAARRHAKWFAEIAEHADRELRTPAEAAARDRLERSTNEIRAAHHWAREHDVGLAARLSSALDLYAHSRHWPEPAAWSAALLPLLDEDAPGVPGVTAGLAAEAAHQGDYVQAKSFAEHALDAGDVHAQVSALETLADVEIYNGRLDTARQYSEQLRTLGESADDVHAMAIGTVGASLALTYGERPDESLAMLAEWSGRSIAPSDRAWLLYAEGEAQSARQPDDAMALYQDARETAISVSNRLVANIATVSMLSLQARVGDPDETLTAFEPVLRLYRRAGDVTHSETALRNLVGLFAAVGDDEIAMSIFGGVTGAGARPTFGPERDMLERARSQVESRVGRARAATWVATGSRRGHRWALDVALAHLTERTGRAAPTSGS